MKYYNGSNWPYPDYPGSIILPEPQAEGRPGFPVPGPVWPYWPNRPWLSQPYEPYLLPNPPYSPHRHVR